MIFPVGAVGVTGPVRVAVKVGTVPTVTVDAVEATTVSVGVACETVSAIWAVPE